MILWTTGKAKTLVESFRDFSDKRKALSDAKAKLKSFYGSRPRTSTEIFHEILKGKQVGINDLEGLQQLWGELKEAEATAEVHRDRNLLDTEEKLLYVIVTRLRAKEREFSKYSFRLQEGGNKISFDSFMEFLELEIKKLQAIGSARDLEHCRRLLQSTASVTTALLVRIVKEHMDSSGVQR